MKKTLTVLFLSFSFLVSDGMFSLTSDRESFVKGSDNTIQFNLKNNANDKLKVKVEVKKLENGLFVSDTESFNILGNGSSFNPGDDLPITLSPSMITSDTLMFEVHFSLINRDGKIVLSERRYIPVVDSIQKDSVYKIFEDKGQKKVISVHEKTNLKSN